MMAPAEELSPSATLTRARGIATALVVGVLGVTALVGLLPRRSGSGASGVWIAAALLAGAVAPAVGYRVYRRLGERIPASAGEPERARACLRATVAALAVTEAAGLVGVGVWAASDRPEALFAVLTHGLLAGAIWPTAERLAAFGERAP